MKFSTTKTIVLEEFPAEVRKWLTKLVTPLNQFLEQTYKTLVNGITLRDNMKCQVEDVVKIGVQQVYPIKLSWKLNEKPTEVRLGKLAVDSPAFVLLPIHSMQWNYNQGQIELYFIGLDTNTAYKATIISQV